MTSMYRFFCTVQRQAFVSDGQGSYIPQGNPTVLATNVRCQVNQRSSKQLQHVGGRTQLTTHEGMMEYNPAFLEGDVITDVAPIINPTDFQMDKAVDMTGVLQSARRQYRIEGINDPNLLHDHLELDLSVIQLRTQP